MCATPRHTHTPIIQQRLCNGNIIQLTSLWLACTQPAMTVSNSSDGRWLCDLQELNPGGIWTFYSHQQGSTCWWLGFTCTGPAYSTVSSEVLPLSVSHCPVADPQSVWLVGWIRIRDMNPDCDVCCVLTQRSPMCLPESPELSHSWHTKQHLCLLFHWGWLITNLLECSLLDPEGDWILILAPQHQTFFQHCCNRMEWLRYFIIMCSWHTLL